eukprot:CAMPEP_0118674382 /NCGR_PEP_ID=MMETSP0800-20121206/857_1 /TAXON_ID=210618 ORGANISM="Striatella unipunctata, Strain CCMP2910" /NCGR_SAMPLE_ID=MMETSP0800 /ASSEMBLY_ACC=CAM_ASM_000638 /LENGTH=104 /DNA_ID=CAMNT_0006569571 /DNA_START=78 /DNA_END=392 /DNA_ORIENTATION=+
MEMSEEAFNHSLTVPKPPIQHELAENTKTQAEIVRELYEYTMATTSTRTKKSSSKSHDDASEKFQSLSSFGSNHTRETISTTDSSEAPSPTPQDHQRRLSPQLA